MTTIAANRRSDPISTLTRWVCPKLLSIQAESKITQARRSTTLWLIRALTITRPTGIKPNGNWRRRTRWPTLTQFLPTVKSLRSQCQDQAFIVLTRFQSICRESVLKNSQKEKTFLNSTRLCLVRRKKLLLTIITPIRPTIRKFMAFIWGRTNRQKMD